MKKNIVYMPGKRGWAATPVLKTLAEQASHLCDQLLNIIFI